MDRSGFVALLDRLAAAWNAGDARGAAACFAPKVDYRDPRRYSFERRRELEPFFEPGPNGHSVEWHRLLFDVEAQAGLVEYTYVGQHRYHGAAVIEVGRDDLIRSWREWQHLDDTRSWAEYVAGPTE